ncbi:unnamed protein product [Gongylonema pulchrum]|uniref:Uncharacterized protein n=1 Tax=Gongylonema pulchrum TaxID=637853 RepID=A0A183DKR7_9BILA|nr:unnamed protein product [Gongylonema pulchrum]
MLCAEFFWVAHKKGGMKTELERLSAETIGDKAAVQTYHCRRSFCRVQICKHSNLDTGRSVLLIITITVRENCLLTRRYLFDSSFHSICVTVARSQSPAEEPQKATIAMANSGYQNPSKQISS